MFFQQRFLQIFILYFSENSQHAVCSYFNIPILNIFKKCIIDNIQLSYAQITRKAKSLPFYTFLHNTTQYTAFCNTIFLKSAKLTRKHLKIMECAARNHLNIWNTQLLKTL